MPPTSLHILIALACLDSFHSPRYLEAIRSGYFRSILKIYDNVSAWELFHASLSIPPSVSTIIITVAQLGTAAIGTIGDCFLVRL
jgi:hypothetical protein